MNTLKTWLAVIVFLAVAAAPFAAVFGLSVMIDHAKHQHEQDLLNQMNQQYPATAPAVPGSSYAGLGG